MNAAAGLDIPVAVTPANASDVAPKAAIKSGTLRTGAQGLNAGGTGVASFRDGLKAMLRVMENALSVVDGEDGTQEAANGASGDAGKIAAVRGGKAAVSSQAASGAAEQTFPLEEVSEGASTQSMEKLPRAQGAKPDVENVAASEKASSAEEAKESETKLEAKQRNASSRVSSAAKHPQASVPSSLTQTALLSFAAVPVAAQTARESKTDSAKDEKSLSLAGGAAVSDGNAVPGLAVGGASSALAKPVSAPVLPVAGVATSADEASAASTALDASHATPAASPIASAHSSEVPSATSGTTQQVSQNLPVATAPVSATMPDKFSNPASDLAVSGQQASTPSSNAPDAVPALHTNASVKVRDRAAGEHESQVGAAVEAVTGNASALQDASGATLPHDSTGKVMTAVEGAAASSQAAPEVRDMFAALDAAPGQPETTWAHTSPRHAEAGYLDPSLGWVSVRADVSSGAMHASIVPSTAEAAHILGDHLAGLNSYLAEHHGSAVTASLGAPSEQFSSMGQHTGQNSGRNSGQDQNGARYGAPQPNDNVARSFNSTPSALFNNFASGTEAASTLRVRAGGISVIA